MARYDSPSMEKSLALVGSAKQRRVLDKGSKIKLRVIDDRYPYKPNRLTKSAWRADLPLILWWSRKVSI